MKDKATLIHKRNYLIDLIAAYTAYLTSSECKSPDIWREIILDVKEQLSEIEAEIKALEA